ncbi:MAG: amidohydrolase [Acidimicrobiia bacterium]|nr:amidohydrolase [Acidimicrobiia bacterium]
MADMVLRDGVVFTVDPARSWATGVAISGGRIAAVARDDDELDEWIEPHTEIVSLDGRMVLPGFQDAHVHPPTAGLGLLRCNLHEGANRASYLETIAVYAGEHPDDEWILGDGWAMDAFPGGTPTRDDLDRVVPDRPVFLINRDGHGAWVNSRALALAGIDGGTPDPVDGRIERDRDGEPAGTLQEGAMTLVQRVVPADTAADYERGLAVAQDYLLSLGVTAWQDADVTPDTEEAYRTMAGRGDLIARVVGALWWERSAGEEQIDDLIARRDRGAIGRFRPTSVKMMLDGVAENFTGSMLDPYLGPDGQATSNRGIDFIDPDLLPRFVTRLDAEGFQVHFHAIGDRAVRNALDAVEAARQANGWSDARHHISHIQVIATADLPRFRRLGVVANGQPFWACYEGYQTDLTIPFFGPERAARQYPFRSLLRHGATLAFGSDWSVSTPNPLLEMETAVRRISPHHRNKEPFFPDERVSLADAIAAFTAGSAYVNHLEGATGSIEVGKAADLVVLDRNIFEGESIGDATVMATIIEGKVAFRADERGL